jgi:cytochrome bd-type quinol oxidase subunit 2
MDDREHRILIEKLGAAKTSEERDRILRDLANQDRADRGESQGTEATVVVRPATEKSEGKTLARLSPNVRAIILLVIAVCGLFFVVMEGMKIMEGRQLRSAESERLFMGLIILVFGVLGFLKTRRAKGTAGGETDESSVDGKPSAGMKALILLMMASCGMFFIVDAVTTIMKGRFGSFEINVLIQGCAFLFIAIFVVLNRRLLAERGRGRGFVGGEAASGEAAGPMQERVAPEMRVAIVVLLAIAGMGSMVWSMLRVMSSRWDGGDMWILIQGCAFLYYAIHLFLKGKTDREKSGGETETRSVSPSISD